MEVDESSFQVLIHFDGWNQRYDEWLEMSSDRMRPIKRHSGRKEKMAALAAGVAGVRFVQIYMLYTGLGFFRKKLISSRTTEETWFLPYFSTFFRKKWKNGIYDKN